jgi:membrane-associated phospholipid phosphatase
MALIGAATGVLLLAVTWYVSHYVGVVRRADVSILRGFALLTRPGLDRVTGAIAALCDPKEYVVLAALPILVALARRRPWAAGTILLILLGANETTQLLKPLLAAPRNPVPWSPIRNASWPSGHATAGMSLALCAVIAAPPRRRPAVAAAMAAFAVAVSYSFLELSWHYPSDVLGGFLVAATWTLLGVAGLSILQARRAGGPAEAVRSRAATVSVGEALKPVAAVLALAAMVVALIVIAHPHFMISYAREHTVFVVGVCSIGLVGMLLASGLTLMLQGRGVGADPVTAGSGPAPRAARRRRWLRG